MAEVVAFGVILKDIGAENGELRYGVDADGDAVWVSLNDTELEVSTELTGARGTTTFFVAHTFSTPVPPAARNTVTLEMAQRMIRIHLTGLGEVGDWILNALDNLDELEEIEHGVEEEEAIDGTSEE